MSFRIEPTLPFLRQMKRLQKKFPSLKGDLLQLNAALLNNPTLGDAIGKNCFKIRLAISSKGGGKRGGARVVTLVLVVPETVFLLDIYDKSEQANIKDKKLAALAQETLKNYWVSLLNSPPPGSENPPSGEGL